MKAYKVTPIIEFFRRYGSVVRIFLFTLIFLWISKVTLTRVGAFGCFDDCFNFVAAHFMLQGKQLFSEIFFNHQPFAAFVSYVIQYITQPKTLYQLVLYHRIFIIAVAYCSVVLFILRFKTTGFILGILYEGTKFFIFGDRFLAESIIVYPIMYMFILAFGGFGNKFRISAYEYYLSPVACYSVIFFREPFIPLALILYAAILFKEKYWNRRCISLLIFIILIAVTLAMLPFKEYVFNVYYINYFIEIGLQSFALTEIMKMIWYPIFILCNSPTNIFSICQWMLSFIWCGLIVMLVLKKIKIVSVICMFIVMGLANIRVVPAGSIYFDAFHMIVWQGLFVCSVLFLMDWSQERKINIVTYGIITVVAVIGIFSSFSYTFDKIQTEEEFNNGYANYFSNGEVIRILAEPTNTLFVEMWDDPIYWVTRLPSSYKYSWYTSIMPFFPKYVLAREEMWKQNPPDFYYGNCDSISKKSQFLPDEQEQHYERLWFADIQSCIYIKKEIIPAIPAYKWDEIRTLNYSRRELN